MVMKKIIFFLLFIIVMIFSLQAQKVSNYTCKLDNGIVIKTEHCWNHVWVGQSFDALKSSDQAPLVLNMRTLGNLISGSSFKLFSSGKEVRVQSATPGTYTMKLTFKLSGKPGTLSFDINDIVIKPQSKTTVSVTLYDYQISITEKSSSQKGLSDYSSKVYVYNGYEDTDPSCGKATFYLKGAHEKAITSNASKDEKDGKIKPGTYDILITFGSAGRQQKVWLENFVMKPDVSYSISTNLNAGVITYAGTNKDVKALHLYPAGTANRQQGAPAPDKNLEIMKCEEQNMTSPCPPGSYDILLNYNNGASYQWRKGIAVTTGARVSVK
jgi:hypothetical protein